MSRLREKTTAMLLIAIFMMSTLAVAVPVFAQPPYQVVFVANYFDEPEENMFLTIQEGIDAVADYGTVHVAPGTYNEHVLINKPLTLRGEDRETTIIDGTGMTEWPTYSNIGVYIDLGSDYNNQPVHVTISGFTVQNYEVIPADLIGGIGISCTSRFYSDVEISDVTVKDNDYVGILISSLSNSRFFDILVDNNDLDETRKGYGIWINTLPPGNGNTFEDITTINHERGTGIVVMHSKDSIFTGITSQANRQGMGFIRSSGTEIHYSDISGNFLGIDAKYADYTVDATLNWWGDNSGPYHPTSWEYEGSPYGPSLGLGDEVTDYALYDPWTKIDEQPPEIRDITATPSEVYRGDILTVTATVTDDLSGVAAVSADFFYESGGRPPITSVAMTHVEGDQYEVEYTVPEDWDFGCMHIHVAAIDETGKLTWSSEYASITVVDPIVEPIQATVDINPDTLNLKSRGRWVTAFITLPEGYSVEDIDPDSVYLGEIESTWSKPQDEVFMVKFDRVKLIECLGKPEDKFFQATLEVTGTLTDGTPFEGSDTIRVKR